MPCAPSSFIKGHRAESIMRNSAERQRWQQIPLIRTYDTLMKGQHRMQPHHYRPTSNCFGDAQPGSWCDVMTKCFHYHQVNIKLKRRWGEVSKNKKSRRRIQEHFGCTFKYDRFIVVVVEARERLGLVFWTGNNPTPQFKKVNNSIRACQFPWSFNFFLWLLAIFVITACSGSL